MPIHSAILTSKFHSYIHLFTPSFVHAILCLTASIHPSICPFTSPSSHPCISPFISIQSSLHLFMIHSQLCTHPFYLFICPNRLPFIQTSLYHQLCVDLASHLCMLSCIRLFPLVLLLTHLLAPSYLSVPTQLLIQFSVSFIHLV